MKKQPTAPDVRVMLPSAARSALIDYARRFKQVNQFGSDDLLFYDFCRAVETVNNDNHFSGRFLNTTLLRECWRQVPR